MYKKNLMLSDIISSAYLKIKFELTIIKIEYTIYAVYIYMRDVCTPTPDILQIKLFVRSYL